MLTYMDSNVSQQRFSEERIRSLRPRKSLGCRLRQAFVGWALRFKFILFSKSYTYLFHYIVS